MTGSPTIKTGYEYFTNTYSVAINNLNTLTSVGDNSTVDWISDQYYPSFCSTLANAIQLSEANIRYEQIILNLEIYATITRIYNQVAVGADQNTPATAFTFDIVFDQRDYVIYPPQPTFNHLQAIARIIAIALSQSYTETRTYFDPSQVVTPSGFGIRGETEATVTAPALGGGSVAAVEAQIVVTQIA
jgi:hypothetical protein